MRYAKFCSDESRYGMLCSVEADTVGLGNVSYVRLRWDKADLEWSGT